MCERNVGMTIDSNNGMLNFATLCKSKPISIPFGCNNAQGKTTEYQNDDFVSSEQNKKKGSPLVQTPQNPVKDPIIDAIATILTAPLDGLSHEIEVKADKTYKYTAKEKKNLMNQMAADGSKIKKNMLGRFMYQYYGLTARCKTYEDKRYIQKLKLKQFEKYVKMLPEKEFNKQVAELVDEIQNHEYNSPKEKEMAQTMLVDFANILKAKK